MDLNARTTVRCLLASPTAWVPGYWLLATALTAHAQMPLHPPEIRTIFPIGGVQGSTVEVLVDGQNVSDPSTVAISGEGVRASVVPEETVTPARIVGNGTARVR